MNSKLEACVRKILPLAEGRDDNALMAFFGVDLMANFAKFLACDEIIEKNLKKGDDASHLPSRYGKFLHDPSNL